MTQLIDWIPAAAAGRAAARAPTAQAGVRGGASAAGGKYKVYTVYNSHLM
jgi:hypothetical protein